MTSPVWYNLRKNRFRKESRWRAWRDVLTLIFSGWAVVGGFIAASVILSSNAPASIILGTLGVMVGMSMLVGMMMMIVIISDYEDVIEIAPLRWYRRLWGWRLADHSRDYMYAEKLSTFQDQSKYLKNAPASDLYLSLLGLARRGFELTALNASYSGQSKAVRRSMESVYFEFEKTAELLSDVIADEHRRELETVVASTGSALVDVDSLIDKSKLERELAQDYRNKMLELESM